MRNSRYYLIRHLESAITDLDNCHEQIYAAIKMLSTGDYQALIQWLNDFDSTLFKLREYLREFTDQI